MNNYKRRLNKIYDKVNKLATIGRDNEIEYFKYVDEIIIKGDWSLFEQMLVIYYNISIRNNPTMDVIKKNTWIEICFQTKSNFLQRLTKYYKIKGVYQQGVDIYNDNAPPTVALSEKLDSDLNPIGSSEITIIADSFIKMQFNNVSAFFVTIFTDNMKELESHYITSNEIVNTNINTITNTDYIIRVLNNDSTTSFYKLNITYSPYIGKIIEREIWNIDAKYYIQNKEYARLIGERITQLVVQKKTNDTLIVDLDNGLPLNESQFNQYKTAIEFLLS